MATKRSRAHGQAFTTLVGNFPYGSSPDHNLPVFQAPPPTRQAVSSQVVGFRDGAAHAVNINARINGAFAAKTASFTVNNNDFSTGAAVIILGDFELVSAVDYAIGAAVGNTATNIAAAITNLPGFTATPTGADVAVEYDAGTADIVDFSITHYGTITNFTAITPATGEMANGSPNISAPVLT